MQNHRKNLENTENQKNLEKTKKTIKPKKQFWGGLGEAPQLPEESRIYIFCFLVLLFFLAFSSFFVFEISRVFCFAAPLPPLSLNKELFSR